MDPQNTYEDDDEREEEPRPPFYKTKKFWIIFTIFLVILTVIVVPVLLLVAFPLIAQNSINGSQIKIDLVNITNPTPTNFTLAIDGSLSGAGPIGATVAFDLLDINWVAPNGTLVKLGNVQLPPVSVSGGSGALHSTSVFEIGDTPAFTEFTQYMLAAQTFVWNMHGTATVTALGRSISGLHVNKDITLNGFDNFPGVSIVKFSLPSDDPQGGIDMDITTKIPNLSPMAIQLGTVVFGVSYKDVYLGSLKAQGVFLKPFDNYINLVGTMVFHNSSQDLDELSELFSGFISGNSFNTTVIGQSVSPDGVNTVPWLSDGLKNVKLTVPLNNGALVSTPAHPSTATITPSSRKLKKRDGDDDDVAPPQPGQPAPLNLITGIVIGALDLVFTEAAPYSPTASSDDVKASYQLPFGFSTNITAVEQNMTIATLDDVQIASIVSSKFGNATTNQTSSILTFTITDSPLVVIPGQEALFQDFTKNLTLGTLQSFKVVGNATVNAIIPIGPVVLSGISFSATVNLTGLDGLTNPPPEVKSVDVIGGTSEGVILSIGVGMVNPSNLQISTGDVNFALTYDSEEIGTVLLPNLTLYRGQQVETALSTLASAQGKGQDLLNNFIIGGTTVAGIQGFNGTTNVTSLQTALPALNLTTQIPGLQDKLIVSASVKILPTTITTKTAEAFVILKNPFTAGFQVTAISSTVSADSGQIGSINVQLDGNPFKVDGHSSGQSDGLPFTMNLDPSFVAGLVRTQAVANGLDVRPLDALLKLGGLSVSGSGNNKRGIIEKRSIFDGFNISSFVIAAFKNFAVTVDLQSTIEIGDYSTPLQYHQDQVPALTDDSITLLIPVVGQPIVQNIVSNSVLAFSTILISDPTSTGFTAHIVGKIQQTGPIDATISFPGGVDLYWKGKKLGNIAMGNVEAKADVGADIDMDSTFTVTDSDSLEAFSEVLLLQDTFTWSLQSSSISVTALGFTFNSIELDKEITLNGYSGFAPFKDGKALNIDPKSFGLFDPPSGDAIGVKATAILRTRSNIGLKASVVFENYFASNDVDLGSLGGTNVVIQPNPAGSESVLSTLSFEGSLVKQTTDKGVATISQLFSQYLSGQDTVLYVKGVSASGSQGNVDWLSKALTLVRINDVVISGIASGFKLIQSVKLDNAELDFLSGSDYSPIISSTSITTGFQRPFPFTLNVDKVKQNLVVVADVPTKGKVAVATIQADYVDSHTTPTGPTTGTINFGISKDLKVPMAVIPGAEPVFNLFTVALTVSESITFGITGSVDAYVSTKIASFTLTNITVDVQTELTGLNNLGGTAAVKSLSVDGGDASGITIHLVTSITNPSTVTIDVGDVSFDTLFTFNQVTGKVGDTVISGLTLKPGTNDYLATFLFNPAQDQQSQTVGSALLSGFLSGGQASLNIKGSLNSTNIQSLKAAFATVNLVASVQGVPPNLIVQSDTYTNLFGMAQAKGISSVELKNVFNTSIVLDTTYTAEISYIAKDYPNCTAASGAGDWLASDFGVKSNHTDNPGPPSFTVGPSSVATSDRFPISFNVAGAIDTHPLVYGLICPIVTSIDSDPSMPGNGTINNKGTVDVSLTAKVLIGGPNGYGAVIQYAQKEVNVYNHFTAPFAAYGQMKTIYCIIAMATNKTVCCACATTGTDCPAPGVCMPLSDGTPVPPPSNVTSSALPSGSVISSTGAFSATSLPPSSTSASVSAPISNTSAPPKTSLPSTLPQTSTKKSS